LNSSSPNPKTWTRSWIICIALPLWICCLLWCAWRNYQKEKEQCR
jgi:hypothetical protein